MDLPGAGSFLVIGRARREAAACSFAWKAAAFVNKRGRASPAGNGYRYCRTLRVPGAGVTECSLIGCQRVRDYKP